MGAISIHRLLADKSAAETVCDVKERIIVETYHCVCPVNSYTNIGRTGALR